jgi:hypothetical protein
VGTILPHGMPAVRAVLEGIALLRREQSELGGRIRAHFFGTSNQSSADRERVMPLARDIGIADVVTEVPGRLDYLDALAVQRAAPILLLLGSTEPHYTPSKLYPALMTGNALLAMYHPASSAREILNAAATERAIAFIALREHATPAELARAAADAMAQLAIKVAQIPTNIAQPGAQLAVNVAQPRAHAAEPAPGLPRSATPYSAESLARALGLFLDRIVEARS